MRWYRALRRAGEIAYVRRRGRSAALATLVAYAAEQPVGPSQVVVTVAKSVGGAVLRNRVRRRIKGVLDSHAPPGKPTRLVLVARPPAAWERYARLADDVHAVLARLTVPRGP